MTINEGTVQGKYINRNHDGDSEEEGSASQQSENFVDYIKGQENIEPEIQTDKDYLLSID